MLERMMVMMVKLQPRIYVPSTSTMTTMVQDGLSPTLPTIQQDQVEAAAKGEVLSRWEEPRRVQVDHCWRWISVNLEYLLYIGFDYNLQLTRH
jgi:hypothetical protein